MRRCMLGLLAALSAAGAGGACGKTSAGPPAASGPAPIHVTVATVQSQMVERMLRITGTLLADEEAEVAAEVAGRVTATPVERGSRVSEGTPLITLAPLEAQAGAADAEANVAQLEARLALQPGQPRLRGFAAHHALAGRGAGRGLGRRGQRLAARGAPGDRAGRGVQHRPGA